MMYSPRGPVCDPCDSEVFGALVAAAVKEGKKYKAHTLKIDKDVNTENSAYRKIVTDCGFNIRGVGDKIEGFQCARVIRIDLRGKTEDEVFQSFDSGHRRKIRVALKNGVEVRKEGSDRAELFFDMMKETTERDGFALRQAPYFKKIVDTFGDKAAFYIAYYTPEGESERAIAGALSVEYGNKYWYFYGASRNENRSVMPNYLVQWEMIREAVAHKKEIYDFRGVATFSEEDGLYRFKNKFGAYKEEFMGEMDLEIKPLVCKLLKLLGR